MGVFNSEDHPNVMLISLCLNFEGVQSSSSLAEFYAILLEGHSQVVLKMLEVGNLFLTIVSKVDQSGSVIFKSRDCASEGRCLSSA
jgi:hypothetical protein